MQPADFEAPAARPETFRRPLRLAFVQDALPTFGGAERLLAQALQVFPGTPVYTLVYNPQPFAGSPLEKARIIPSFLNRLPGAHSHHRWYLPLYPRGVESLDLSGYDGVISFSYAAAHGAITRPDQAHLALIYRPLRQAYSPAGAGSPGTGWALQWLMRRWRAWDEHAGARPDTLLAVSHWIAGQVWRAYHRPAQVLYPPVEVERFSPAARRESFYVALARLESHKRLDLVVEAFNRLGYPLLVVGAGRQRARLEKLAQPNIRFLGRQPDTRVAELLGRARALVHMAEEDFGIAIVEAQAAGCPVIAYAGGGASETVIHGRTGLLFGSQNADSLVEALLAFEGGAYDFEPHELRQSAERFSAPRFRREFADLVQAALRAERFARGQDEYHTQPRQALAVA